MEDLIGEKIDGSPLETKPEDTRNQAAVALSKLGASKGGVARAEKLSPTKRRAIAKKAAKARWG
jgi:ABC-type phosphate/phosphonate transport system ATPase subunit